MSRLLKIILLLNLLALAVLAFVYPNLMEGPGKLIPGHKLLEGDCFACHAPFTGTSATKCVSCHKPADIGRMTTAGVAISKPLTSTPFHQKLISEDCVACHSDHAGVKRFVVQGRFNHTLLKKETRNECQACHKSPTDSLHQQISGNCAQCHTQEAWTPATFDHDKFFVLDGDHNTRCVTCHVRNDYSSYTCYGCHEHTTANIRRKHIEEGISKFDDCVECHRSADENDIQGGKGRERDKRKEND
ncbi:MAG: class III cytochrome C family protein [Rhodoferax sp.]|uniref:cytochrome c3 family protein n=1 Tax=Rhodoferax sp. TaxID=50421 RepID=UPI0017D4EC70|nr:cytochrome c3 family protein [Rhodoferax sp.]NMM19372.1 class III cytochrome C family protein [Rhodoferax sp.]